MITLMAVSRAYQNNRQFIARITGRDAKFTFQREFVGRKQGKRGDTTEANIDEPGLFEVCDIDKRGNKDSSYAIVVAHPADTNGLIRFWAGMHDVDGRSGVDVAMMIAKRMDAGEAISDMIECVEQPEDPAKPGVRTWKYRLRAKSEVPAATAAPATGAAVGACWQVLQALPEHEAREVLAALEARLSRR